MSGGSVSTLTTIPLRSAMRPIPETYRHLRRWLGWIMGMFFRRVEVAGLENIPAGRGGVLVAWHPNGLVDPGVILSQFPFHVVFGARHTLFKYPIMGPFIRALGTVPIYRRMDTKSDGVAEQRNRNDESLAALAQAIANGSYAALFPEGYSHDQPFLREVKTGAARLYYRARMATPEEQALPVIIPVGLHYDQKRVFRSSVLVEFYPPLKLTPDLDVTPSEDDDPEETRELARKLTDVIERELKSVVRETESWELHNLLHRGRSLIRAERASRAGVQIDDVTMDEQVLGFQRIWLAYNERLKTHPVEVAALRKRVQRYDRDMRGLKIDDHELDQPPPIRRWFWLLLAMQIASVLLLLPPLLLIGAIVNIPPAASASLIANLLGKEEKDAASLKLVAGIVFFPATWLFWAWMATTDIVRSHPWFAWIPGPPIVSGLLALIVAASSAAVLLVYFGLAVSTWRALRVRFTRGRRARSLLRLKLERGRLCDELLMMASGIALPGTVGKDGRVSRVLR